MRTIEGELIPRLRAQVYVVGEQGRDGGLGLEILRAQGWFTAQFTLELAPETADQPHRARGAGLQQVREDGRERARRDLHDDAGERRAGLGVLPVVDLREREDAEVLVPNLLHLRRVITLDAIDRANAAASTVPPPTFTAVPFTPTTGGALGGGGGGGGCTSGGGRTGARPTAFTALMVSMPSILFTPCAAFFGGGVAVGSMGLLPRDLDLALIEVVIEGRYREEQLEQGEELSHRAPSSTSFARSRFAASRSSRPPSNRCRRTPAPPG
ncbi:MAG: hypothetical protein EXS27_05085 [Pedosphaera sp.]|nr:hypothetical protein [Pedosphaera sp.]